MNFSPCLNLCDLLEEEFKQQQALLGAQETVSMSKNLSFGGRNSR